MVTHKIACLAVASLLSLGGTAYAATLKNMDDVSYTIYVETDDATKTVVIEAHGTITDICSNCYIGNDDSENGITVTNEAVVILKDGQFSIE